VADQVIGCDGAQSAVSELNGIGFPAPMNTLFVIAVAEATGSSFSLRLDDRDSA
jgi:hypothetical protein